jgi:hypothetical protein
MTAALHVGWNSCGCHGVQLPLQFAKVKTPACLQQLCCRLCEPMLTARLVPFTLLIGLLLVSTCSTTAALHVGWSMSGLNFKQHSVASCQVQKSVCLQQLCRHHVSLGQPRGLCPAYCSEAPLLDVADAFVHFSCSWSLLCSADSARPQARAATHPLQGCSAPCHHCW